MDGIARRYRQGSTAQVDQSHVYGAVRQSDDDVIAGYRGQALAQAGGLAQRVRDQRQLGAAGRVVGLAVVGGYDGAVTGGK